MRSIVRGERGGVATCSSAAPPHPVSHLAMRPTLPLQGRVKRCGDCSGGSLAQLLGWRMIKRPISDFRRKTAKVLRENTTAAENILWRHLQRIEIKGSHFRRQVPIGPYIVDFACLKKRLVIEVDGSQHGNDPNSRRDEVRTRWLNSQGYRVMRFWNNDVMSKTETVLEAVYEATAVTPPRLPLAGDPESELRSSRPPPGEGGSVRGE
jgi:very-short-patch-repair endonuclease